MRSFARTVGPPLAAGPRSLLQACRGRSGGSRWSMVGHRRVSTPVKAAHHPSSLCRFLGSGLLVHRVGVWRRDQSVRNFPSAAVSAATFGERPRQAADAAHLLLLAGSQRRCLVDRAGALKVCLRSVEIFDWKD